MFWCIRAIYGYVGQCQSYHMDSPSDDFLAVFRAIVARLEHADLLLLRARLIDLSEHSAFIAVINEEYRRKT